LYNLIKILKVFTDIPSIIVIEPIYQRLKRECEKMVRKVLLAVALILAVFWLASCQTVSGVGKDITWTADSTAKMLEKK
jgi:predicted small secreted protein